MTLQLRTNDDLIKVLSEGISSPWKINLERLKQLTHVEIYSFDGNARIIGTFDLDKTRILSDGKRVAIAFKDAKIEQCEIRWVGFSPVRYKM